MTQHSWPWSTVAGLGDGASELGETASREALATYFRVQDPTVEGVSVNVGGELAVSGAASPLTVQTGSAICYGLYWSDAVENPTVTTPAIGTTGGRVVLQTNWAGTGGASLEARTRIAIVLNTDGNPAIPALTQTVGVTWEISLATFTITTGGVISLADDRTYRKSTATVGVDNLEAAIAGNGLSGGAGSALAVNVDNVGIEISGDILQLKDAGVVAAKIAAAVAGNGLGGGAGAPLSVNTDGVTVEISGDTLQVRNLGIDTGQMAADAVDDTKAGDRVAQFYRRQGGNASNFATPGTTTYTPTALRVQWGSIQWSGSAAQGSQAVSFPVAFSNTPLVLACCIEWVGVVVSALGAASSGVTLWWKETGGSTLSTVTMAWIAIGPE